jgi:hypothetical protein
VKLLQINGDDLGVIHAKKTVAESRIWLTARLDDTWCVVVEDPDQKIHAMRFIPPPQESRARRVYDDLSTPHKLRIFLEGLEIVLEGQDA